VDPQNYFEQARGFGILATADAAGNVDAAVYARPHFVDDQTIAFVMADKLSYRNLQSNPKAMYLFKEEGERYIGHRLYLTKVAEDHGPKKVEELTRRVQTVCGEADARDYVVYFHIDRIRPLVGD